MFTTRNNFQILLLVLACSFSFKAFAFNADVLPATTKVHPKIDVPVQDSASIHAARNEWEGFQIVIFDTNNLKDVTVVLSDLKNEQEAVFSKANCTLYREHFLLIDNDSNGGLSNHLRSIGYYPDPLIPFTDRYTEGNPPLGAPFDLEANKGGIVFVDCHVPMEQEPGMVRLKILCTMLP